MDIRVALVKADKSYWLDRRISELRGGQEFSHAALVVCDEARGREPLWIDVHWRWVISDLRFIPARNYGWEYRLFPVAGMNNARAYQISRWVSGHREGWSRYDLIGALSLFLGIPGPDSPRAFTCFEFVARALIAGGYVFDFDPELALASDLISSGVLLPAIG